MKPKLNYKRTIFVGFAFFLICAFWQAYEAIVPLMLVNKFGMNQTWSGVIMALDNVLAVFMLPIFGALSDKTKTKFGKRTPYIVLGTIVAIAAFVGLTFADNAQLANIAMENGTAQQMFWESNSEIPNAEKTYVFDKETPRNYKVRDYAAKICFNKNYDELTQAEQDEAKEWFIGINAGKKADGSTAETYYSFDTVTKKYDRVFDESAHSKDAIKQNAYNNLVNEAHSNYAWQQTLKNPVPLVFFILLLLVTLIAMATFRSPAVALMPDVTVKPLRSQANAIINLMGTAGAMIVLALGIVFKTSSIENQTASFTGYVVAVCALMAIALIAFIFLVKEPVWAKEMEEESERFGLETKSDEIEDYVDGEVKETSGADKGGMKDLIRTDKAKFRSLILILASVALWYIGYNAVSSKYSLYATNILHKNFNTTLLIAQAAAILSYIPAGMLASKIGRKKSILIGIVLLVAAFFIVAFFDPTTPAILIDVFFALGGIGWATINVNSFPMVVELAKGGNVGKYTGYYYTASMAAQIITPILSGFVMDLFGSMHPLFFYSSIFAALSFVTMLFVKHGDNVSLEKIAEVNADAAVNEKGDAVEEATDENAE